MMTTNLSIAEADFSRDDHRAAVLALLSDAAADPTSNGETLPTDVRGSLIPRLQGQSSFLTFLALVDAEPAGIAIGFCGQSHARGQAVLYLSDLFVQPAHRRHGVGRRLLEALEDRAHAMDCCRLVLEVQQDNVPAVRLYESVGFAPTASPMVLPGSLRLVKPLRFPRASAQENASAHSPRRCHD